MTDRDTVVLQDALDAAFALDKAYRSAYTRNDLDAMRILKPEVEAAFNSYSKARLKLLEDKELASDADVTEMRMIRAEIDQAANTQQFIEGAFQFVKFLAKFV